MNKIRIVFIALFITVLSAVSAVPAQTITNTQERTEWIANVIRDVQKIKIGMTRGEMREVFGEEGGISTTRQRQYVYLGCLYIKVDFEFEPRGPKVKDAEGRFWQPESDQDLIKKMSKPYLEFSIAD